MTQLDTLLTRFEPPLPELEGAYRQHYLAADIRQVNFLLMLVIIASTVFISNDYALFQQSQMFYLVAGTRLLYGAILLGFFLLLKSIKDYLHYDRIVVVAAVIMILFQNIFSVTRPTNYYGNFAFDILSIVCAYLVVPNTLLNRTFMSFFSTILSLSILFIIKEPWSNYLFAITASLILVNIIGFTTSARSNRYRRRTFQAAVEMAQLNEKLTVLANTDGLTGVLNRRRFVEIGNEALAAAQEQQQPLALVMLDIDFFKQVNDRYGHDAGDEVLRSVARLITVGKREGDSLGRLGGEEFALLLPKSDGQGAYSVIDRIREQIAATFIHASGQQLSITFSAGVSQCNGSSSFEEMLRQADVLLYQAKKNGRNRVEIAPQRNSNGFLDQ
jgi:diguanylate cyclase (GGDEF)-like protein